MKNIIRKFKHSYSVAGVITEGQENRFFVNVKTNEKVSFYFEGEEIAEEIGKYSISKRAMSFANNVIKSSYSSQIIFIDEVGRLEGERKCMYEQISGLVDETNRMKDKAVIMIVREDLLHEILVLLDIKPMKIWSLHKKPKEKNVREIYDFILHAITKGGREDCEFENI